MRKSLLVIAAICGIASSAMAQQAVVNTEIADVEESAAVMTMDNHWEAIDMLAAEEVADPIVSIKRPGGVFLCGYLQTRNSQLTTPYAKAPAYAPLTWGISKKDWSGNSTLDGEYTLAVPYAATIIAAKEDWYASEGEEITGVLAPMASSFYSSPYATCTVGGNEMKSALLPQYTSTNGSTYDPHLYAGGALPKSSTYGYAMAGNYSSAWAGSNSSHPGYGTLNTVSSNWNTKLKAEDATPIGFLETFDKPASAYMLQGINAHCNLPSGGVAGTMNVRVRKCTLSATGSLSSLGEVIATGTQTTPTATNSATWIIYNFDELKNAAGEVVSYVIVDSPIVIEIYSPDGQSTIRPMYKTHSDYFDGENHAYTMVKYTDASGASKTSYQSTNFKWTSNSGDETYQSSFMIGMNIIYPYAKVVDENNVPTTENIVEFTAEGGSKELMFDAYYSDAVWDIYCDNAAIEVTPDYINGGWESSVDWLTVSTEKILVDGKFYGDVKMVITLDENKADAREFTLTVDCYGFKEPISVKQAGTTTSINGISAAKAGKTFNLAGQQVDKNYKGVVICNGKKTINM